jgi:hypothetical protein
MGRRNESVGEILLKSPWWISVVLGVFAFAGLRWGVHAWFGDNKMAQPIVTVACNYAPVAALIFGVLAGLSFWFGKWRLALVDQQTSLESLRGVPWKDFEFLVAEAYRRQGFFVPANRRMMSCIFIMSGSLEHLRQRLQSRLEHVPRRQSDQTIHDLAVFEKQQRRHGLNLHSLCERLRLVHVNFDELDLIGQRPGEIVEHGRKNFARATPGRVKIHHHRQRGLNDLRFKLTFLDAAYVWRGCVDGSRTAPPRGKVKHQTEQRAEHRTAPRVRRQQASAGGAFAEIAECRPQPAANQ